MSRTIKIIIAALAVAASGAGAYAAKGTMENDAVAIAKVGIPLAQAVTIAERHVNGKAARAEYEDSKQGWVYDVEVVTDSKVFDVRVDASKGNVISSVEDKEDHDDDHDKKD